MKTIHLKMGLLALIVGGAISLSSWTRKDMSSMQLRDANFGGLNSKGITTAVSAYYDARLFTIQLNQLSSSAASTQISQNPSINHIYQSDPGLPGNLPFISVIDAVPGDGMNPVWREVQITFNPGFTPRQLFSDNEILAAASGANPEISLTNTNEVYICPVMGK